MRSRQSMAAAALLVCMGALFAETSFSLDEEEKQYISKEEQEEEIRRRNNDIMRTTSRLESLSLEEMEAQTNLEYAKAEAQQIEDKVIDRVKIFYRLYRNGGSVRYLLGASSITQFLRRLGELRYLLKNGFENQRQAGLRLAQADSRLEDIQKDKQAALEMLSILERTLAEIEAPMLLK